MAGPTPGTSLNAGSRLVGCALALRARGPDFRLPPAPAGGRDRYRILMIGDRDGEAGDEPLFCERAAGIDIGKQLVSVTIRVPSDTRRGGRQQETREFGTTRRQLR